MTAYELLPHQQSCIIPRLPGTRPSTLGISNVIRCVRDTSVFSLSDRKPSNIDINLNSLLSRDVVVTLSRLADGNIWSAVSANNEGN